MDKEKKVKWNKDYYVKNKDKYTQYSKNFKEKKLKNKNCDLSDFAYITWIDKGLNDSFIYNSF